MTPEENEIEELRDKLRSYYGTALTSGLWPAAFDLSEVDIMSDEEVIAEAERNNIR